MLSKIKEFFRQTIREEINSSLDARKAANEAAKRAKPAAAPAAAPVAPDPKTAKKGLSKKEIADANAPKIELIEAALAANQAPGLAGGVTVIEDGKEVYKTVSRRPYWRWTWSPRPRPAK